MTLALALFRSAELDLLAGTSPEAAMRLVNIRLEARKNTEKG